MARWCSEQPDHKTLPIAEPLSKDTTQHANTGVRFPPACLEDIIRLASAQGHTAVCGLLIN